MYCISQTVHSLLSCYRCGYISDKIELPSSVITLGADILFFNRVVQYYEWLRRVGLGFGV